MTARMSTSTPGAIAGFRCVVIGAGGLGHPVIAGLMALGVSRWVIVDPDTVEASNLHRQWLFSGADRHRPKAEVAAQWILARRPTHQVQALTLAVDPNAPLPWAPDPHDFWLECSDRPRLKFWVSQRALQTATPCVIGGVLGWAGQVFAQYPQPGCYHCLFEAPPPAERCASCESAGVLTTSAAQIGAMMVARANAMAQDLANRQLAPNQLTHLDLKTLRSQTLKAPHKRDCCHCSALASRARFR